MKPRKMLFQGGIISGLVIGLLGTFPSQSGQALFFFPNQERQHSLTDSFQSYSGSNLNTGLSDAMDSANWYVGYGFYKNRNFDSIIRSSGYAVIPATAMDLALAIGIPSNDILAADTMGSDPNGVGVGISKLGNWFPTEGETFAILSTGNVADAIKPIGELASTELNGLNNNQDNDLVRLHLQLKVPSDKWCFSLKYTFYSEEYPEYVGSEYNDTFTSQYNHSVIFIRPDNTVDAHHNFTYDRNGNPINLSSTFGAWAAEGTVYDGVITDFEALSVSLGVVPGSVIDLYFSIQDVGDSLWDSAAFLDNFDWCSDRIPGFYYSQYLPMVR